ncbi:MAG: DUF6655 family protein [Opitutaceae bacterium]
MVFNLKQHTASLLAITAIALVSGCTTSTITQPSRTGLEQLLLSNAVDNALGSVELPEVNGKTVYLSEDYFEAYDGRYIIGTIRAILSENGAKLTDSKAAADIVVEARSGALGIDSSSSLLGIPAIPIIIPGAGNVEIPELALYKAAASNAVTKIALLAYDQTGANVFSSDTYVGKSHFKSYKFLLLLNVNFTDIPERENY